MIGLDIAFEPLAVMRSAAGRPYPAVQADIEALPFKPGMFEGIVIASVLQWLCDPIEVLRGISGILKPEGYLAFSAFIDGSFFELFETLAGFAMQPPVHCPPPERLTEVFSNSGFVFHQQSIVRQTLFFVDARAALKSLSGMGAAAREGRRLTRRELDRLCNDYERRFRSPNGVPLTYCAMIGLCRKDLHP